MDAPKPSPAMLRAVLFDATGTLFVTREEVGEVYSRFAAQHGVELPGWRLDDAFRRVLGRAPSRVFPDADSSAVPALERKWWWNVVRSTILAADSTARFRDFDVFFDALYTFYATADAWELRPGALRSLRAAHSRSLRIGLISNFDHRIVDILEALDISQFFEFICIPSEVRIEKPDPGIFEAALVRLGEPPEASRLRRR